MELSVKFQELNRKNLLNGIKEKIIQLLQRK